MSVLSARNQWVAASILLVAVFVPDATALPTERGPLFAPYNPVMPEPPDVHEDPNWLIATSGFCSNLNVVKNERDVEADHFHADISFKYYPQSSIMFTDFPYHLANASMEEQKEADALVSSGWDDKNIALLEPTSTCSANQAISVFKVDEHRPCTDGETACVHFTGYVSAATRNFVTVNEERFVCQLFVDGLVGGVTGDVKKGAKVGVNQANQAVDCPFMGETNGYSKFLKKQGDYKKKCTKDECKKGDKDCENNCEAKSICDHDYGDGKTDHCSCNPTFKSSPSVSPTCDCPERLGVATPGEEQPFPANEALCMKGPKTTYVKGPYRYQQNRCIDRIKQGADWKDEPLDAEDKKWCNGGYYYCLNAEDPKGDYNNCFPCDKLSAYHSA